MSVQPSLNNSNMVVAEIINEINSTQPVGNYSQNTRATPIQHSQRIQQAPQQQIQQAPQQQIQQVPQQQIQQAPHQQPTQRATPIKRSMQQHPQQQQQPQQQQPLQQKSKSTPINRLKRPHSNSFMKQQQKSIKKQKKVKFKEQVKERIINDENDSDTDSDMSTEIMKSESPKSNRKHKFLKKDDVKNSDLTETKGLYSKLIHFFTKDTKEPLLVLVLVFAISMPIVNKLLSRFVPFLMKNGDESLLVVGVKALVVAFVFFAVKKLLL